MPSQLDVKQQYLPSSCGHRVLMCLQENIGAFDKELPAECLAEVEQLHKKFRDPVMS